jgi:hypothetical protein
LGMDKHWPTSHPKVSVICDDLVQMAGWIPHILVTVRKQAKFWDCLWLKLTGTSQLSLPRAEQCLRFLAASAAMSQCLDYLPILQPSFASQPRKGQAGI